MKFSKTIDLVYADIYKVTKVGDYHIISNVGVINDDITELQEKRSLLVRLNSNDDCIQRFLKVNKIDKNFISTEGEELDTFPFGFNKCFVNIDSIEPYESENKKMIMIKR